MSSEQGQQTTLNCDHGVEPVDWDRQFQIGAVPALLSLCEMLRRDREKTIMVDTSSLVRVKVLTRGGDEDSGRLESLVTLRHFLQACCWFDSLPILVREYAFEEWKQLLETTAMLLDDGPPSTPRDQMAPSPAVCPPAPVKKKRN